LGFGYGDHYTSGDVTQFGGTYSQDPSGLVCDPLTQIYWYAGRDGLVKVDPSDQSSTLYAWADKAEWLGVPSSDFMSFLRHKTPNTFDYIVFLERSHKQYELYHYTYTLGGSLTDVSNYSFTYQGFFGVGLAGDNLMIGLIDDTSGHWVYTVKILNLTSSSTSDIIVVDPESDLTTPMNGVSSMAFMSSYGGGILFGVLNMIGTNLRDIVNCTPFTVPNAPQTAELWATCYTITKYGGSTVNGPTLVDSWDINPSSHYFGMSNTGPLAFEGWTLAGQNSLLNKAYTVVPIGFEHRHCNTLGGTTYYRGLTMGVSWPDMSTFYYQWSDSGAWWILSDEYEPTTGSDVVRKPAGFTPNGGGSNWDTHYSKYGGSVISNLWFNSDDNKKWYEVRGLPNYSTLYWRGTGANPGPTTVTLAPGHSVCDFTGQIASWGANDVWYMATKGNLDSWNTRVDVANTTQNMYITQHLAVGFTGNRYYFYGLEYDQTANFPLGTVLKHTSTTELDSSITASDLASEQTLGIFEVIHTTSVPTKVDIAKDTPTVIYDIPETLGNNSQEFAASVTNTPNSFYTHADPKPVYEARNFDLPKPGTFPSVSGTFNPVDYERYVGIANQEGILASDWQLNTPWVNMVIAASGVVISGIVPSGLITHFETSNYQPEGTYFFYTVSGVKTFYQKNPIENFWRDYSAGLPDSDITIIRVDDVI
jgi:hypothetical protein